MPISSLRSSPCMHNHNYVYMYIISDTYIFCIHKIWILHLGTLHYQKCMSFCGPNLMFLDFHANRIWDLNGPQASKPRFTNYSTGVTNTKSSLSNFGTPTAKSQKMGASFNENVGCINKSFVSRT